MPLAERVAEIRAQQQSAEIIGAQVSEAQKAEALRLQERIRAENLADYFRFEHELNLKMDLEVLAAAEGLVNPKIHDVVKEPSAEEVEIKLEWEGVPKRVYQKNVMVTPPRGFFSISITWSVDDEVKVSGEEEVGFVRRIYLDENAKSNLEELIALAYLKPRWNKESYQIMLQSQGQVSS